MGMRVILKKTSLHQTDRLWPFTIRVAGLEGLELPQNTGPTTDPERFRTIAQYADGSLFVNSWFCRWLQASMGVTPIR
jgi:hypothetical protein